MRGSIIPWKKRERDPKPILPPPTAAVREIAERCANDPAAAKHDLPQGVRYDSEGLTFEGLTFDSDVSLCSLRLPYAVTFKNCKFGAAFDARWLNADALSLKGSHLQGPFRGLSLKLNGHLDFEGVTSDTWIDISVAEVGGDIKFASANVSYCYRQIDDHGPEHPRRGAAVFAGGVRVHSLLMDHSVFHGRIFLDASRITGILKATGASIESYYAHRAGTGLHSNFEEKTSAERPLNQWDHLAISATDCTFEGAVILGRESRGRAPEVGQSTFTSFGQINLSNAVLKGDLVCTGAKLHSAYWHTASNIIEDILKQDELPLAAVHASRALIDGAVFLDGAFAAHGEVRLNSVEIRGVLRCENALMDGRLPSSEYSEQPSEPQTAPVLAKALGLARAQIGNDLVLGRKCIAFGTVNLRNASLQGDLNCCGGTFIGWRTKPAVASQQSQGAVRRAGILVDKPDQPETIAASGAEVRGHVLLGAKDPRSSIEPLTETSRFVSYGQVRLRGAKIGGNLHLDGGVFDLCESASGGQRISVNARGQAQRRRRNTPQTTSQLPFVARFESLQVTGATFLANSEIRERTPRKDASPIEHAHFRGSVTFEGMSTTVWEDSEDAWPQRDMSLIGRAFFELNGLTYQRLSGPLAGTKRLIWLLHQPDRDLVRPLASANPPSQINDGRHTRDWGFKTQPWEQCANVLYQMGYRRDARFLYRQQQRFIRIHSNINFIERSYNTLLGFLVGHGYRPYYALFWALSLWILGWAIFDFGYRYGQLAQAKMPGRFDTAELVAANEPERLDPFNPALFSLDVLLPVVSLNEQSRWDFLSVPPAKEPLRKNTLTLGSSVSSIASDFSGEWERATIKLTIGTTIVIAALALAWYSIGEIIPGFRAGGAKGNSRAWRTVYRRALTLRGDSHRSSDMPQSAVGRWIAIVGGASVCSIILVSLWAMFVLCWLLDQAYLDRVLAAIDHGFMDLLKITFVHFWMVWQTLWGWVLVSALIVGVGGTIFRSRDAVR